MHIFEYLWPVIKGLTLPDYHYATGSNHAYLYRKFNTVRICPQKTSDSAYTSSFIIKVGNVLLTKKKSLQIYRCLYFV